MQLNKLLVSSLIIFLGSLISFNPLLSQSLVMTAIMDGPCSGGLPKMVELYADGTVDFNHYSIENQNNANSTWGNTTSLAGLDTVTNDYVYVILNSTHSENEFTSKLPNSAYLTSAALSVNGDDRIRIINSSDMTVIDQYGESNTDGTGEVWEYTDGYAVRVAGTGPDGDFVASNWTYGGTDALDNNCATWHEIVPIGQFAGAWCDTLASQNFDALGGTSFTADSLPSGSQLTNTASFHDGSMGLGFASYWYEVLDNSRGPKEEDDSGDFIGVNDFGGSGAPNISADSIEVSVDKNFQFNDVDGKLILRFDTIDVAGFKNRNLSLDYWINSTSYESTDSFYIHISDGQRDTSFLNYSELQLEANASIDSSVTTWHQLIVNIDSLIINQNFGEELIVSIVAVNDAGPENIFVDNILMASGAACHEVIDDAPVPTMAKIHEIQGAGNTVAISSPVTVEAIVTGLAPDLGGFYLQEELEDYDSDPSTSEGIFVWLGNSTYQTSDVSVGDSIRVTGTPSDFGEASQIASLTNLEVLASNAVLPPLDTVRLPITDLSDWEKYECMRVVIRDDNDEPLVVNEHYQYGRFGNVALSCNGQLDGRWMQYTQLFAPSATEYPAYFDSLSRNSILLDDARSGQNIVPVINARNGQNLSPSNTLRAGDYVHELIGFVDQKYPDGGVYRYRIQPADTVRFQIGNERPDSISDVGGDIRVASLNVLNYFNGDGQGGGFPTPRGAETLQDFEYQEDKIVAQIIALDADIIALQEIENDGFGSLSAIQQLVDAVNTALGVTQYHFVSHSSNSVGDDQIAVGIMYDSTVVVPVGSSDILEEPGLTTGSSTNRVPLLANFTDKNNLDTLAIVVNHLKSKGGSGTGPDADMGDGAGNYNDMRRRGASAIIAWAKQNAMTDKIVLTGDFNAYAQEDPIRATQDSGFVNLFSDSLTYSFSFNEQWGSLDYAFVTQSLMGQITGQAKMHVNADEPGVLSYSTRFDDASLRDKSMYRASDHDPIVFGIALPERIVDPCPQELAFDGSTDQSNLVNGALSASQQAEAKISISNIDLNDGGPYDFRAGTCIELGKDFTIESGVIVDFIIENCANQTTE